MEVVCVREARSCIWGTGAWEAGGRAWEACTRMGVGVGVVGPNLPATRGCSPGRPARPARSSGAAAAGAPPPCARCRRRCPGGSGPPRGAKTGWRPGRGGGRRRPRAPAPPPCTARCAPSPTPSRRARSRSPGGSAPPRCGPARRPTVGLGVGGERRVNKGEGGHGGLGSSSSTHAQVHTRRHDKQLASDSGHHDVP